MYRGGVQLTVDIGENTQALITRASLEEMGLVVANAVWVSFKSTAIRFIADDDIS
jgi:molybdopterin-binding protein